MALIGEQWLTMSHNGTSRLDDPGDFVRIEVETALQRSIPLVPVLVGGAAMPGAEQLPQSMAALCFRHAAPLDPGRRFDNDIGEIICGLEKWWAKPRPGAAAPPKRPAPETVAPVQLFEPGEFEAEERRHQAACVKAAEDGLAMLVVQCLERTLGKPDQQANAAIAAYCHEKSLDSARARAVIAEARARWSVPKQGQFWTNSPGMKFAWIPPGTFMMGSPNAGSARHPCRFDHEPVSLFLEYKKQRNRPGRINSWG